jgi:hypothetical protein
MTAMQKYSLLRAKLVLDKSLPHGNIGYDEKQNGCYGIAAGVAELVGRGLKIPGGNTLGVRVSPPANKLKRLL